MKNDLFPYLMLFSLILNMEIKLKEKGLFVLSNGQINQSIKVVYYISLSNSFAFRLIKKVPQLRGDTTMYII